MEQQGCLQPVICVQGILSQRRAVLSMLLIETLQSRDPCECADSAAAVQGTHCSLYSAHAALLLVPCIYLMLSGLLVPASHHCIDPSAALTDFFCANCLHCVPHQDRHQCRDITERLRPVCWISMHVHWMALLCHR
jgi:hypothetical protein